MSHEFEFWAACTSPGMSGELIRYLTDGKRARRITYRTFARQVDFETLPGGRDHPALYRVSAPDNWTISFWRSSLPSGQRVYYFKWSGIEHIFADEEPDFPAEVALLEQRKTNPPRVIWSFASGTASPGEIVGHARAGMPPGVAMLRSEKGFSWLCGESEARGAPLVCWDTLRQVARTFGVPVFVDSGAYGEFGSPYTITHALWQAILRDQLSLAMELGPNAVIVMPDKVNDQKQTLARLRKYRKQVNDILDTGARAVVVMQPGPRSAVQMAKAVSKVLGRNDWTIGFPTTARANRSPAELRKMLESLPWEPAGVHLLGLSPHGNKWDAYMSALAPLGPDAWASADAVAARRLYGRESGLKPLTIEEDRAHAEIMEEAWIGVSDPLVGAQIDPTEQLPDPSAWMIGGERSRIAREARRFGVLSRKEAARFRAHPTAALVELAEAERFGAIAWLEQEVEQAWWRQVGKRGGLASQIRKERGRRRGFGTSKPLPLSLKPRVVPRSRPGQVDLFELDES